MCESGYQSIVEQNITIDAVFEELVPVFLKHKEEYKNLGIGSCARVKNFSKLFFL